MHLPEQQSPSLSQLVPTVLQRFGLQTPPWQPSEQHSTVLEHIAPRPMQYGVHKRDAADGFGSQRKLQHSLRRMHGCPGALSQMPD